MTNFAVSNQLVFKTMKRFSFLIIIAVLSLFLPANAQQADNYPPDDMTVVIDSTNLPIVWIDVNGAMIMRDDRIGARMKIIHNGKGQLNYGDTVAHPGQHVDYEGYIALRYRGNTSFTHSDKKPYSFRTLSKPYEQGYDKKKVSLLGMGSDNNWALLAPYSDKSMIRDLLAFEVARPWMEYTPQGRLCELFLDGTYYGVFILTELVTQGKHRLNLPDPGEEDDELTGGYIVEVGNNGSDSITHISKYHPIRGDGLETYYDREIEFLYKFPDAEDLTDAQREYINGAIDLMEDVFASKNYKDPVEGYRKYIDVQSFMDYQLVNEFAHNVDGYRLSTKLYKRRDSEDMRFKMAIWDMNLAFGNCRHNQGSATSGWISRGNSMLHNNNDKFLIPFWWYKLISDNSYVQARFARWAEWRNSNLSHDRIMATIDSLANEVTCCGAEARNSQAWPRWGVWVWPNYVVTRSYEAEIEYIKNWIVKRTEWLDDILQYTPPEPPPVHLVGDVNDDGELSVADVTDLIEIILRGPSHFDELTREYADVDQDGEIAISDVTALIELILRSKNRGSVLDLY